MTGKFVKCMLIGGPLDGEVIVVSESTNYYHAPDGSRLFPGFNQVTRDNKELFGSANYRRINARQFGFVSQSGVGMTTPMAYTG